MDKKNYKELELKELEELELEELELEEPELEELELEEPELEELELNNEELDDFELPGVNLEEFDLEEFTTDPKAMLKLEERHAFREKRAKKKKYIRIIKNLGLLLLVLSGVTTAYLYSEKEKEVINLNPMKVSFGYIEEDTINQLFPETTILISSMGDCTLGTDLNYGMSGSFMEMYNNQSPEYFFSKVKSVLEEDDLSIVNLEGPLTTSTNKADKQFAFRGDMSYAKILSSGSVEAACIANNHSKDYGEQGFVDTKTALEDENITHFGYEDGAIIEVNGIKVGLVGIYVLAQQGGIKDSMITTIENVKEQGAQVIIANFHWGVESTYYPIEVQTSLAHTAIDYGVDVVIGHHPHVLQGVELYKDKYIVYSLGNFSFGGNKNPRDKDTIIFQNSFTFQGSELVESSINIIPCSLSSVSSKNNYQPMVLTGEEAKRVGEKLIDISSADIREFIEM